MALTVVVTITGGTDTGPFNIFSCTGATCAGTAFTTKTKAQLTSGHTLNDVPNGTTKLRVTSTGNCVSSVDLTITGVGVTPTPTPTPQGATPTPTPTPTPTASGVTPNYYVVRRCDNSVTGITVNTPIAFLQSGYTYTLIGSHPQMDGILCWEVTGIVHTGSQYDVSYDQEYDRCQDCTVTYFDAYTGSTLAIACAQTNSHRIWYHGSLGVGTVLYNDASVSAQSAVGPGFYWYNDEVVLRCPTQYIVEDGRVEEIHLCSELPTPTPTPVPMGYFTGYVSDGNAQEACDGGIFGPLSPVPPYNQIPYYAFAFDIVGNAQGDLCNAAEITSGTYGTNGDIIKPMAQGGTYDMNPDFWISDGTNVRKWRRQGTSSSALPLDTCVPCSGGTPIPTATPTPTPTPNADPYVTVYYKCGTDSEYYYDYYDLVGSGAKAIDSNSNCYDRDQYNILKSVAENGYPGISRVALQVQNCTCN
jgi:hypothetical protein